MSSMRVYTRREFLELPAGTMFSKGRKWVFDCLSVKGDSTRHNDFFHRDLDWIDANDSGQAFDRLEEMLKTGASYPIEQCEGRDGTFDDGDVFLVWESEDLKYLRETVEAAIALAIVK